MAKNIFDANELTSEDFLSFYNDAAETHHPLSTLISIKFSHERMKIK